MTRRSARDFADLLHPGDPAAAWFRRRVEGRIFVVMEGGTLCVNFIPGCGFTLEPGTTNSGWMVTVAGLAAAVVAGVVPLLPGAVVATATEVGLCEVETDFSPPPLQATKEASASTDRRRRIFGA